MKAIPILNNKSWRRLDGSTPNDVERAINSKDPEDKVLEFKVLISNAHGPERNDEEHKGGVKELSSLVCGGL